jgi:hypothetical protein
MTKLHSWDEGSGLLNLTKTITDNNQMKKSLNNVPV